MGSFGLKTLPRHNISASKPSSSKHVSSSTRGCHLCQLRHVKIIKEISDHSFKSLVTSINLTIAKQLLKTTTCKCATNSKKTSKKRASWALFKTHPPGLHYQSPELINLDPRYHALVQALIVGEASPSNASQRPFPPFGHFFWWLTGDPQIMFFF